MVVSYTDTLSGPVSLRTFRDVVTPTENQPDNKSLPLVGKTKRVLSPKGPSDLKTTILVM